MRKISITMLVLAVLCISAVHAQKSEQATFIVICNHDSTHGTLSIAIRTTGMFYAQNVSIGGTPRRLQYIQRAAKKPNLFSVVYTPRKDGKVVDIVSITIDPWRDGKEVFSKLLIYRSDQK